MRQHEGIVIQDHTTHLTHHDPKEKLSDYIQDHHLLPSELLHNTERVKSHVKNAVQKSKEFLKEHLQSTGQTKHLEPKKK